MNSHTPLHSPFSHPTVDSLLHLDLLLILVVGNVKKTYKTIHRFPFCCASKQWDFHGARKIQHQQQQQQEELQLQQQ